MASPLSPTDRRASSSWRKRGFGLHRNLRASFLDHVHVDSESNRDHHGQCCSRGRRELANLSARLWRVLLNLVDIGNCSMVVMALIACTGLLLRFYTYETDQSKCSSTSLTRLTCYFLSAGLFGFIGGFTNWLAVAMLFTKIRFLYGSGVIPTRFREIRVRLRHEMISTILDNRHISEHTDRHLSAMVSSTDVPRKIATFMANPEVDSILQRKLNQLRDQPEGQLLAAIGIQPDDQSTVKAALVSTGAELAPAVLSALAESGKTPVELFRRELDNFITQRAENLDQETVTNMLRQVLRPQLGWVVLWGSFFGMLTGIIVEACGIAPQY